MKPSATFILFFVICVYQQTLETSSTDLFKSQEFNISWPIPGAKHMAHAMDCANTCLDEPKKCFAFHITQTGSCYCLINNEVRLEQKNTRPLMFWLRKDSDAFACNASLFPYAFEKSRYFVEKTKKKTWHNAWKFCQSIGGKLAHISSNEERLFVARISFFDATPVRIGLHREVQLNGYTKWKWWPSKEPLINPEFWGAHEPTDERLTAGFDFSKDGTNFYAIRDKAPFPFVCECQRL